MKHIILCLIVSIGCTVTSIAQHNYPPTKTVDSIDTYFGVVYKDPYRWLENLKDSNVINWFKQQKKFADNITGRLNGTDSFINQLIAYSNAKTWGRLPQYKHGNRYYYNKWERGQLSENLYYKSANGTAEQLLFDSWKIHPNMRYNMQGTVFSPDGKYFLAAFDKNGEEYPFIKVYDLERKKWLKDSIPHCW